MGLWRVAERFTGTHGKRLLNLAFSVALIGAASNMASQTVSAGAIAPDRNVFPTMDSTHRHAWALLSNAMKYVDPKSGTREPSSGYPVEGWNNEPGAGLGLRSFTQLTAIGEWAELLANVAAGSADTPGLSRDRALKDLQQLTKSLLRDQQDPETASMGLLGNFLDLSPGRRMGPLAGVVEKSKFTKMFGETKGEEIWQALKDKGWLSPQSGGREAVIQRKEGYGAAFFDGPLTPFADGATKTAIMSLLDQRTVTAAFGDNANLSSSLAMTIGALMSPGIRSNSKAAQIRKDLDLFLENQREGYSHLYDKKAGLFYFGWDANRGRYLGSQDPEGNVQPGYMDYMVNEFRGPTAFVITRYGLPANGFANLRFRIKPYNLENGNDQYVLAPWDGSAFQALGLGLSIADGGYRSWEVLLKHVVDVEIDYARRHKLPGFLSESYIGEGARYTGDVGIPDIAVNESPRITHVASLYTLGVAYRIAPSEVEQFIGENWALISTLLTDHGPWEGFDASKKGPVRIQTTAHTLSLILGLLGTGPRNMTRYLEFKELHERLSEIYMGGEGVDLLSGDNQCFAWDRGGNELQSARQPDGFHVKGPGVTQLGVAYVSARKDGLNLSNGKLTFGYRSGKPLGRVKIQLKPVPDGDSSGPLSPLELDVKMSQTDAAGKEINLILPATAGLAHIKEVVLVGEPAAQNGPVDLEITKFNFVPY